MKVVCNLIKPGVPTVSGRIYSQEALEKLVEMTNQQAKDGYCFVLREAPPDGRVSLKETVGLVRHAKVEADRMVCSVELLNAPNAFNILAMLEGGAAMSIAPLAYGQVKPDGTVVEDSLQIHGWSFVLDNKPK